MKKVFLLVIALILTSATLPAREQYVYTQISHNEGLTYMINSIYKKDDGHIWIGTNSGLFRFNGTSLHHYQTPIFTNKIVHHIEEDAKGNLWVLTNDWFLKKEKGSDAFKSVKPEQGKQEFYSMLSDSKGIWFGSVGKVYRYDYKSRDLRVFCEITDNPEFTVQKLLLTKDEALVCTSYSGVITIDTHSGSTYESPFTSDRSVSAALKDSKGRIWLAFYNKGIEIFSSKGKCIKTYCTENSDLNNNIVLCLTERDSRIWAGTDGGGINIIDPATDRIKNLNHIAGDPSSLPTHSIKSIFTDSYGNIWAGSNREGLIGISSSKMITHSDVHIGMDTGLSSPTVLSIYQDESTEDIWIGTDGEGLNRFRPSTHKFTHFPSTLKTKIVSIASYNASELVISAYGDGFHIFNKQTGRTRPLRIEDEKLNHLMKYSGKEINIANEKDGSLLILGNSIHRYDKSTCRCTHIPVNDGTKISGNIHPAGTSKDGLWLYDLKRLYFLPTGESAATAVTSVNKDVTISSCHLGKNGKIWMATSAGLQYFDKESQLFYEISTDIFEEATSVVCDNSSRIWIGSGTHLYAYLPKSDTFAMFGKSDGAAPNEFLSKARLLSRNGDIYLGGVQGLVSIDESFEVDTSEEPTVMLYNVTVDGDKLFPDKKGRYHMPRGGKELTIKTAVREKDIFRKKVYRYSFSDDGGTFQTPNPHLILKRPRAGKYAVTMSCTKRDGGWTEPVKLLDLNVLQPWYLSWWFICSLFILAAGIISTLLISLERQKIEKLRLEQKEQEQKSYEEKVQMLINMSHELRTPLTLIMAPLKRLIKDSTSDTADLPTLNRIYRQSRRMKTILNMVLDLRKMEVGKSRLKIEVTDTHSWITEVAGDFIDEERSEGIDITVDIADGAQELKIDRQKCETVLSNILMNAIKHSKSGDTISIKAEPAGEMIRISISDQGPGLGDADLSQLFTQFYQSNSEKYGSGIGLSYSQILVQLHGGNIGAYNNEDKGATFWWEIPVSPVGVPEEISGRAYLNELMGYNPGLNITVPESEAFHTEKMTLMLVDDNADLLDFLQEALCRDFAQIFTAKSGNAALKIISSGKLPDIIVSDVNMPDGDGYHLCQTLKSNDRYSHIPIVLLTARGEDESQSDSYKMGADGFMAKPFEIETLSELLRGLLRKRSEVKKRYLDEDKAEDFGSEEEAFIIRFNKIVSEHLGDPDLDQQLICRELGMSRALLYNKMKAITGTGAKEYITRIRIEKAKNLMENPSLSIADIADMTGFTSQSYFSTAFKAQTGLTPSQYRQKDRD